MAGVPIGYESGWQQISHNRVPAIPWAIRQVPFIPDTAPIQAYLCNAFVTMTFLAGEDIIKEVRDPTTTKMALITSGCDKTCALSTKWP